MPINRVAPGVFTADAGGRGLAAAVILRVKADSSQSYEPIARFDTAQNDFAGIAQFNIRLSRQLIGRGEIDAVLSVDGQPANAVKLWIK